MTRLASDFDTLYRSIVLPAFAQVADTRAGNASYKLADALKSGFAIYALKSVSLFKFRQRTRQENSNLK